LSSGVAAVSREDTGRQLAAWLHAVVAGAPSYPSARLVDAAAVVTVTPRWDGPEVLTLVVNARGRDEAGRIIGKRGGMVEHLRCVAGRIGARLGLRVWVEVVEA
jgi:predicted RNA-binding protein YlqC (UPF0109 family)